MRFIDTHAHLNFAAFRNDAPEVIKNILDNGIWVINIGTNYQTSKRAVEIAQKYNKGVWAGVGLHPVNLDTGLVKKKSDADEIEDKTREKDFDYEQYKELAKNEKVVAIGEVGLDYYWKPKTTRKKELFKQKQKDLLLKQLKLAKELELPVVFHCRMAHQDLYEILKLKTKNQKSKLKGVMHGFVGTTEQLEKYLKLGLYIGFNGIIFKQIQGINFVENIRNTPLDRILLETDCPYLTPPDFQEKKNNPLAVKIIAEYIARVKNIPFEEIAEAASENAKRLFRLE